MEPEVPKVGQPIHTSDDGMPEEIDNNEFESIMKDLQSTEDSSRIAAVTKIKQMLYNNPNLELETTINRLINKGILDILVEIIKTADNFELKYQTIWAFVNICCGNSTQIGKVVEVGVVELAVQLIDKATDGDPNDQNSFNLALESVWLLGNIAGDGLEHRDACLELDAAHKIIRLINKFPLDKKLLENSVWTLQNLVAKKPAPFWNQISEVLPLFISVIKDFGTSDLNYHALWGICYISASYTVDVLQSGCVPTLVKYLASEHHRLVFPALQTLGNLISTTKDHNTDEVLRQPDFLPNLFNLCSSTNQRIRVYATWAVSNIAAGTPDQIAKIIEKPEYLDSLNAQLKDPEEKIRYQASCALANLMFRATIDQIETLVTKHHYLDGLLEVMKQEHPRTYERNFVEPINRIATLDITRQFTPIFKNKGLIEQMQNVANSLSFEMRTMSNDIINKYFTGPQLVNLQPAPVASNPMPVQPVVQPAPASTGSASAGPAAGTASPRQAKNKAPKPQTRKKIVKIDTEDPADKKKKLIKRTKTMLSTIEEAKDLLKGMKKGGRTRKSSKPAAAQKKTATPKKQEKSPAKRGSQLKRTNTMKQTLSEAKKILKQIDAVKKLKK